MSDANEASEKECSKAALVLIVVRWLLPAAAERHSENEKKKNGGRKSDEENETKLHFVLFTTDARKALAMTILLIPCTHAKMNMREGKEEEEQEQQQQQQKEEEQGITVVYDDDDDDDDDRRRAQMIHSRMKFKVFKDVKLSSPLISIEKRMRTEQRTSTDGQRLVMNG